MGKLSAWISILSGLFAASVQGQVVIPTRHGSLFVSKVLGRFHVHQRAELQAKWPRMNRKSVDGEAGLVRVYAVP